jgi:small-conductance mechanosensitive channel
MIAGLPPDNRMVSLASLWRRLPALVVTCLAVAVLDSGVVFAKDAAPAAAKLPEPLTRETARELVSRLSDAEVRALLLQQLDRTAAKAAEAPGEAESAGMLGSMHRGAGAARDGIAQIVEAVRTLPEATRATIAHLSEPDGIGVLGRALAMFAAALVVSALVEWVVRRASSRRREALRTRPSEGPLSDAIRLLMRAALEVGYVLVFGAVGLALFFALWQGHETRRMLLLGLLGAVVVARIVYALASFLLAPSRPAHRLLPLDDATAATLTRTVTAVTAIAGLIAALGETYAAAGADDAISETIGLILGLAIVAICIAAIWRVRKPIGDLIRGAGGASPITGWIADLWPFAAIVYVLSIFSGRVWETITGTEAGRGEGILSLAILVGIPVADYALSRMLTVAVSSPQAAGPSILRQLVVSYEPVLRRVIHILLIVVAVLALAELWDLDLFGMAQRSLGGQIASSLLGIGLVLLIGYISWEVARTAIDRRLAVEANVPESAPTSRLRTLLPLLRVFIAITLVVMTALSVLAALGVNILPLLAGAGIVGVAIGFGSQTLVKDIVSGAFFLMDDAFRIGEYIEVGDAKGVVEKITVRAVFLRHHRGALNVLPYGQIARLRNTSRDWMIMTLDFPLALETDLRKVKKIIKAVGEQVAADPELGPALLSPLKSQGVIATDESSLTLRVKYMVRRPGDEAFLIRRMAYENILKAFKEQGIEFASRRVAVYVPPGEERDMKGLAAAALPAIEAQALEDKGKAK